jgi:phosphoribosylamine---glycine ligase
MTASRSSPRPCPERCNILLIGGGGREHAIGWKISQSPRLGKLWIAESTNAGLAALGEACPVPMNMKDTFRMKRWCETNAIDLIVVGPEAPLAAGITDALQTETRRVFGPTRAAAQLEADKAYAKQVMRQAAIPTADAKTFTNVEAARHFVLAREDPCVVKATGLAAGKGAIVCDTQQDALDAIDLMLVQQAFGEAGRTIIIEEKLSGQEVSVLALVDGRTISLLDPCQDHKQVGEGDTGPNTGGMGAYCPTPVIDRATMAVVEREIMVPMVDTLRRDGIEFRGVLYAGLMLTPGGPKVLEFNVRFGDPECQPLMMRLRSDLIGLLWATSTGRLGDVELDFDDRVSCCVVMCAEGYPGAYEKGRPITGIEDAEAMSGERGEVKVFHAGTTLNSAGELVTSGGRVLGVTAMADDLQSARDLANDACSRIRFPGAFHRRDIGDRVLVSASRQQHAQVVNGQ